MLSFFKMEENLKISETHFAFTVLLLLSPRLLTVTSKRKHADSLQTYTVINVLATLG